MRCSTLFVFGLLLVLFAVATSGWRHSKHRRDFELYYPEEVRKEHEKWQNFEKEHKNRNVYQSAGRSAHSSVDYHKDYLKSLGGQEGSHKVEQELLKHRMKKGKRYN